MFLSNTFIVSPVFTTRDANLIDMLKTQHAMAKHTLEKEEPFFRAEGLVNEVMAGLLVDSRYPDITFVTPASWVFHTLNFSTVCRFSIVCTNTLRAFSSSFIRELVLLYGRCLQMSSCFQDDHDCAMLLERLDNGFRQAVAFEDPKRLLMKAYSTDIYYLDQESTIGYFEYFREEFDKVTLHNLICEDSEEQCVLRTHQEGYYFNGLPPFVENKSSEKIVRQLRERAFRQEFLRFISLLSAPVYTTHDIGQYHKLNKFITRELEIADKIRVELQQFSDQGKYRLPFITTKEYAKSVLQKIIVTEKSEPITAASSSSSFPSPPPEKKKEEEEEEKKEGEGVEEVAEEKKKEEERDNTEEKKEGKKITSLPPEEVGGCSIM